MVSTQVQGVRIKLFRSMGARNQTAFAVSSPPLLAPVVQQVPARLVFIYSNTTFLRLENQERRFGSFGVCLALGSVSLNLRGCALVLETSQGQRCGSPFPDKTATTGYTYT